MGGGAESHDDDVLSMTFTGSPGTLKWDGHQAFSTPVMADKKTSHVC